MARLGLGPKWNCLFANDIDPKKAASYRANFSNAPELKVADVSTLIPHDLPGCPDLVWASFPCQDLSLAGAGAGLSGERSGAFWPFWKLIVQIANGGRKPTIIALENVCGTLTSHGGRDFASIANAIAGAGYRFGAMILDAADFVPQSRQRLFIVAVSAEAALSSTLTSKKPNNRLHPPSLLKAHAALPPETKRHWLWWKMAGPEPRVARFVDLLEDNPADVPWASLEQTRTVLDMMSPINLAKVHKAQLERRRIVGAIYRRTRLDEFGNKIQRAEIRFDDISGCLRTPAGGSSRQRILLVDRNQIRTRLLSAREAARLMGLPETYCLPDRYNDAYHLTGDGVVVPVVRHIAELILEPILDQQDIAVAAE